MIHDAERRREANNSADRDFIRRVLIVLALAALAYLVWQLSEVLLLVFGAVVVAVVLRSCADLIARRTPIPRRWSLMVAGLAILLLFAGHQRCPRHAAPGPARPTAGASAARDRVRVRRIRGDERHPGD